MHLGEHLKRTLGSDLEETRGLPQSLREQYKNLLFTAPSSFLKDLILDLLHNNQRLTTWLTLAR